MSDNAFHEKAGLSQEIFRLPSRHLPLAKTPALKDSPSRTLLMEVSLGGSYGVQLQPVMRALPHHCDVPGLVASGLLIVLQLTTIFMLRGDRVPVMLTCYQELTSELSVIQERV